MELYLFSVWLAWCSIRICYIIPDEITLIVIHINWLQLDKTSEIKSELSNSFPQNPLAKSFLPIHHVFIPLQKYLFSGLEKLIAKLQQFIGQLYATNHGPNSKGKKSLMNKSPTLADEADLDYKKFRTSMDEG